MKLEDLKAGLFGYNKMNVFQLISEMENDYSAKLMEMHKQAIKIQEQQLGVIMQLEDELKTARKQLKKQKSKQHDSPVYSRQYFAELKDEMDEKDREAQQMLNSLSGITQQELDAYQLQLQNIREMFHALMVSMSNAALKSIQQYEGKDDIASKQNMSLFTRSTKSDK